MPKSAAMTMTTRRCCCRARSPSRSARTTYGRTTVVASPGNGSSRPYGDRRTGGQGAGGRGVSGIRAGVRQTARPAARRLPVPGANTPAETLLRMTEAAAWCSADPLCAEHTGQGFGNLNRAACHACALLPETSCETGNTLLDRALVVGGEHVPGYLESIVAAARSAAADALEET